MNILMLSGTHFSLFFLFTQQYELKNFVLFGMWRDSWDAVIFEDLCFLLANEDNCEGFCGCEVKYNSLFLKKKMSINLYNSVLPGMTSVSWLIPSLSLLLVFYGGTDELDLKNDHFMHILEEWLLKPPWNLLEKLSLGLTLLTHSNAAKWGPRDVFTFSAFQVTEL